MTSVCVSLPLMQASVGAQFGVVCRINGPLRKISDHMGLMFRQNSHLTTSSISANGCNTFWLAAITASSAHYASSGVQNSSKMLPICSDCSESDFFQVHFHK